MSKVKHKELVDWKTGKPIKLVTLAEALANDGAAAHRSKAAVEERRSNWFAEVPDDFAKNAMGGLVYFIDCLGLTKIGFTSKPIHERIETWLNGNPFDLSIFALMPGTLEAEREMHILFKRHRERREWFRLSQTERERIMEIVTERGGVIIT